MKSCPLPLLFMIACIAGCSHDLRWKTHPAELTSDVKQYIVKIIKEDHDYFPSERKDIQTPILTKEDAVREFGLYIKSRKDKSENWIEPKEVDEIFYAYSPSILSIIWCRKGTKSIKYFYPHT